MSITINCNWPIVIGNQQLPAFLLVLLDGSFLCSTLFLLADFFVFHHDSGTEDQYQVPGTESINVPVPAGSNAVLEWCISLVP